MFLYGNATVRPMTNPRGATITRTVMAGVDILLFEILWLKKNRCLIKIETNQVILRTWLSFHQTPVINYLKSISCFLIISTHAHAATTGLGHLAFGIRNGFFLLFGFCLDKDKDKDKDKD